jgi:hypothetical protein
MTSLPDFRKNKIDVKKVTLIISLINVFPIFDKLIPDYIIYEFKQDGSLLNERNELHGHESRN